MSREKRPFSIGSARNATYVISKRWDVSIWPTTRKLSLSWKRSSARTFTRLRSGHQKEGSLHEDVYTKHHGAACARCVVRGREFVHKKGRLRKTEQRRLLHLHDASIGAREGTWKMSNLLDGSDAGDEMPRDAGKF